MRFGDAILQAGHTAVPNLALDHYAELGVSPTEFTFIVHIWARWWTKQDPFPSLGAIAAQMGVSRRQVRTYAQRLKEKGLLTVRERTLPGLGQVTSEYDFSPFIAAIVALGEGEETPPGKNPSEGPRKNPSSEEDKEQEDEYLASKRARAKGGEEPRGPDADTTPVSMAPQPQRRGPISVAKVLAARSRAASANSRQERQKTERARTIDNSGSATLFLDSAVTEVICELGDNRNLRSDLAQARNLFRQSGLQESSFVERVWRARSLVRERQHDPGPGIRRRGAYFFAVLRDLMPNSSAASADTSRTNVRASTPHQAGHRDMVSLPQRIDGHSKPERANLGYSQSASRPSRDGG